MKRKIVNQSDREIVIPDQEEVFILDYINNNQPGSPVKLKIGDNCSVKYVLILGDAVKATYNLDRQIYIGNNSQVESYQAYFGTSDLQGQIANYLGRASVFKSQAFFYQIASQNLQIQDNYTFQDISSTGKFMVTGLLDDQAKAAYYSDIIIEPAAQGTDSRIDMKLYLFSDQAAGRLLPGLKIAANEVKAGHGASTFNLSGDDLFYLQSRGLASSQIKSLVVNSLADHFLSDIADPEAKKIITALIAKRQELLKKI